MVSGILATPICMNGFTVQAGYVILLLFMCLRNPCSTCCYGGRGGGVVRHCDCDHESQDSGGCLRWPLFPNPKPEQSRTKPRHPRQRCGVRSFCLPLQSLEFSAESLTSESFAPTLLKTKHSSIQLQALRLPNPKSPLKGN